MERAGDAQPERAGELPAGRVWSCLSLHPPSGGPGSQPSCVQHQRTSECIDKYAQLAWWPQVPGTCPKTEMSCRRSNCEKCLFWPQEKLLQKLRHVSPVEPTVSPLSSAVFPVEPGQPLPSEGEQEAGAKAAGPQPARSSQNLSMASRQARHRSCILLVIQALNREDASLAGSLLSGRKTRALVASSILEGPWENPIAA